MKQFFIGSGLLLLVLGASNPPAAAQKTLLVEDTAELNRAVHAFERKWIDQPFPLIQHLKDLPDDNDFLAGGRATMVFMGFSGCHPCQYQLPFLFRFIKERPRVAFVYLTFDSRQTFEEELARLDLSVGNLPNLYFIHVQKQEIGYSGLADFGYPAAYFLNAGGVIKSVEKAGWLTKDYDFFEQVWQKKLAAAQ